MTTCRICHERPAVPGNPHGECGDCAEAREYWANLTPAERRAEDEAIARYTEEALTRGD